MCKEMPVIPVNKVVDPKRIIGIKMEMHIGSLTPPTKRKKTSGNPAHLRPPLSTLSSNIDNKYSTEKEEIRRAFLIMQRSTFVSYFTNM
jgi:hypothetical protein